MKDAMWDVDGNDGMGFQDPRTRGAPLAGPADAFWLAPTHPELLELVKPAPEGRAGDAGAARAVASCGDRAVAGQGRQARRRRPAGHEGPVSVSPPGRAHEGERDQAALIPQDGRHLVPDAPVQLAAACLRGPAAPLLEEERHPGVSAQIPDRGDPGRIERPVVGP